MARAKGNKIGAAILAVFAFVVGGLATFVGCVFISLPQSYAIPARVTPPTTSANLGIDVEKVTAGDLSIHFLELGNRYTGDCTLIKVGDTEVLIDAGSKATSVPVIAAYLEQYVTDHKLEYVVVTHAHEDHYAGFATNSSTDSLFDLFGVGTIIEFAKTNQTVKGLFANYLRERNEALANNPDAKCFNALECYRAVNGAQKEFALGDGITMTILYQKFYEEKATTENNYSVCLQITQTVGGAINRYLFTGDLEKEGEASLAASNPELGKTKLYKAGHHGSKTSSHNMLLNVIQPEIVCVCCCAGSSEYTTKNENQFPTQEFVDRVALYTDQIYVTTLCLDYQAAQFTSFNGTIVMTATADEMKTAIEVLMYFSSSDRKLKDSDWFAANRTWPDAGV